MGGIGWLGKLGKLDPWSFVHLESASLEGKIGVENKPVNKKTKMERVMGGEAKKTAVPAYQLTL